ncbi:hypothetical protein INQ51_19015 [Maribellus sp. CM-23]|uniref:hypothetical protein n=1 Tax=Maribellus sp. CM-23 TaxID=2781026 RepID=UPI001F448AEA|nr:hypothetical protein [Maribellus sp. CM-23]MCE4566419.1 hypothetical protein [Maribellus sp. CM-23]
MFNWEQIKSKIKSNSFQSFTNGIPQLTEEQIDKSIELFKKLVLHNVGNINLNGLAKQLFPALQTSYVSNFSDHGALRVIADSLEPFLKKASIVGLGKTVQEVENKTLIPILKDLGINSALTAQVNRNDYPNLSIENLDSFRNQRDYLYEICSSYLIRNKVHVSPDLSDLQILTYLNDLMVVYLFVVHKFSTQIENLPVPQINSKISNEVLNGQENKMLFDFISFGNSTTEIKSQVLDAFILHYLIANGVTLIDKLKEESDSYFGKILSCNFYKRKVENLRQKGKVEFADSTNNSIKLSVKESERLSIVQADFNENKELFLLYFKDIIDNYEIEEHFDSILELLTDFFVNNFNIDIKEVYESEIDKTENVILDEFLTYLKEILSNEEKAISLLKDLFKLCEQSDFVIRVSASKVLGKLTNPEYFQNYIRQQKRIVYIDTQLVLHALCTGYVNKASYENGYYQIIDELLEYSKEHPNIELKFSRLYLSEVAYQLKLAILLVPFEDMATSHLSNNVFFLFYKHLKENSLLEEDDDSFGAFLENWLYINEDDALHSESDKIISSSIADILNDALQIDVVTLPYYENRDAAVTILEETIRDNSLSPKSYHILANDALMVCHLSNQEEHQSEPFFLTWDRTFTYFRKAFKSKFKRREAISWHLFNPSKFLNHMSLIDFKIEPKTITSEYLSIIDGIGMKEKTRTIYDNMIRFLDIKDISKKQRKKYIELTSTIFNEKEFSYEVKLPEEEITNKISKSFEDVLDNINTFLHDSTSNYSIDMYRKMLLNEDYFIQVVDIVKNEIIQAIQGKSNNTLKDDLVAIIKDYEKKIKTQHNIL